MNWMNELEIPGRSYTVDPTLPVRDLFEEPRARMRAFNPSCFCNVVFDAMHMEINATPLGVGMEDDDFVTLVPVYGRCSEIVWNCATSLPRTRKTFSLGLNVTIGVDEGGLPIPKELIKHGLVNKVGEPWVAHKIGNLNLREGKEDLFFVGPVRNSTPENAHLALPIVQLVPCNADSTVDELAHAWAFYARKEGIEVKEEPSYLVYTEMKVELGKKHKIVDIIDQTMTKHYFCLPPLPREKPRKGRRKIVRRSSPVAFPSSKFHDENIDKMVEFLEGEELPDDHSKKKKKNRVRKKKKATLPIAVTAGID